jgi:hypothetical protein
MKLNLIASTIAVGFVSTVIAMETNKDNLDGVTKAHILQYLPESTPARIPPKAMLTSASNMSAAPAANVAKKPAVLVVTPKSSEVVANKTVNNAPEVTPVVAEEKTADSSAAVANTQKVKAQKVKNKGKKGKGKKGRKKKA